jgi:hypothetical protein
MQRAFIFFSDTVQEAKQGHRYSPRRWPTPGNRANLQEAKRLLFLVMLRHALQETVVPLCLAAFILRMPCQMTSTVPMRSPGPNARPICSPVSRDLLPPKDRDPDLDRLLKILSRAP